MRLLTQELLALEDEMGVVSTALSEEELSKCIRISLYKPFHMKEWRMRDNLCLDDTKCSICQVIVFQVSFVYCYLTLLGII